MGYLGVTLLTIIGIVTYISYRWCEISIQNKGADHRVTVAQVWYYGWLTAISTGLGVLPFYFIEKPNKYCIGISNGATTVVLKIFFIYD